MLVLRVPTFVCVTYKGRRVECERAPVAGIAWGPPLSRTGDSLSIAYMNLVNQPTNQPDETGVGQWVSKFVGEWMSEWVSEWVRHKEVWIWSPRPYGKKQVGSARKTKSQGTGRCIYSSVWIQQSLWRLQIAKYFAICNHHCDWIVKFTLVDKETAIQCSIIGGADHGASHTSRYWTPRSLSIHTMNIECVFTTARGAMVGAHRVIALQSLHGKKNYTVQKFCELSGSFT